MSSRAHTVLIVDDEKLLRDLIGQVLAGEGYAVVSVPDGRECIRVLQDNPDGISLVLLDWTMPVMGGRETYNAIRQIKPDVPVILATGHDVIADIDWLPDQAPVLLTKPYSLTLLSRTVKAILHAKHG